MSLVEGMQWYPRVSLSYHPNTIVLIYFEVNPISTAACMQGMVIWTTYRFSVVLTDEKSEKGDD